jgi:Arc/MetJ family transcription regulator
MRTNIDIDERLLADAQAIAGTTTKKATVEHALRELIRRKQRQQVRDLLGTVDWIGDLDETRSSRRL